MASTSSASSSSSAPPAPPSTSGAPRNNAAPTIQNGVPPANPIPPPAQKTDKELMAEMSAAMVNAGKMIIEQADLELLQEVGKMFGYCRDVLDDPEVLRILLKKGLQIFEDRESGIREVSPSTRTFCLLRAECMRKGCVNLMEFLHACTHGLCLQCHMETSKERSCVVAGCNNFSSISIDVSGFPKSIPVRYAPKLEVSSQPVPERDSRRSSTSSRSSSSARGSSVASSAKDFELKHLFNTLTFSNTMSDRLRQTNVSLEKLKIQKARTMTEASSRVWDVLKERELRACGYGRIFNRGGKKWCQSCRSVVASLGAFPCGSILCNQCINPRDEVKVCPVHHVEVELNALAQE